MNTILINRQYNLPKAKTWYDPKRFLESKKSVEKVYLVDTTSSAGDWGGIIVQVLNGYVYFIRFYQVNEWFGFSVTTEERVALKMSYYEWRKMVAIWGSNMDEIINRIYYEEYQG